MKKIFFTLVALLVSGSIAFSQNVPMNGSEYCAKKKIKSSFVPHSPSQTEYYSPVHTFDVLKYTLNVNLFHCFTSPYPHDFPATEVIDFKVDSVISSITLNALNNSLTINS